jgi:hypothetical protein
MVFRVMKMLLVLVGCSVFLVGCGAGSPNCVYSTYLELSPKTATADHSAAAPGNQQQFTSESGETAKGTDCAVPLVVEQVRPVWTNPEPLEISISSANDSTNGLATCLAATNGPITLTATTGSGKSAATATASLTCE